MKKILATMAIILALGANSVNAAPVVTESKAEQPKKKAELASLPKEKADMLEKAVKEYKAKSKEISAKIKVAKKEIRTIISAENFNKEEYLKKSAELAKLESEKLAVKAEAIAAVAPKFTTHERKNVLAAFNRSSKKTNSPKTKA